MTVVESLPCTQLTHAGLWFDPLVSHMIPRPGAISEYIDRSNHCASRGVAQKTQTPPKKSKKKKEIK